MRLLTTSLGLLAAAALAAPAAAETLADAIAEAYQNNPNLQAQRATQRATDEEYVQARSGWRPTLTLQATGTYQQFRTPRSELLRFQRFSTIERDNSGAALLAFTQPIWTGGRTAAQVTAANADVLQGRENLRRLEGQLMQAVIQAYADVLRDQQAVTIHQENVKVLGVQLDESRALRRGRDHPHRRRPVADPARRRPGLAAELPGPAGDQPCQLRRAGGP